MKIEKTNLPKNSILQKEKNLKFVDGYKACFIDQNNRIDIKTIGKLFFTTGSTWIDKLFALRNNVVKVFGLKTSDNLSKNEELANFNCEQGEKIGLFTVFHKSDHELILGENDKHLNFRVSLFLESYHLELRQKQLTITTLVQFNNLFGKFYFIPVKPFHKQIVPTLLKGIIKEINTGKTSIN